MPMWGRLPNNRQMKFIEYPALILGSGTQEGPQLQRIIEDFPRRCEQLKFVVFKT